MTALAAHQEIVVNKGTELLHAIDAILKARALPPLTEAEIYNFRPIWEEWGSELVKLYRFPRKQLRAAGLE